MSLVTKEDKKFSSVDGHRKEREEERKRTELGEHIPSMLWDRPSNPRVDTLSCRKTARRRSISESTV